MTPTSKARTKTDEAPPDDQAAAEPLTVDEVGAADTRRQARQTAMHRRRVQHGEYGQWVAAYDIRDDGNALMFSAGHPVPVDQVDEDTRSVVIARHRCHHTPDVRCEKFNQPEAWTEPGAVVRPAGFEDEDEGGGE